MLWIRTMTVEELSVCNSRDFIDSGYVGKTAFKKKKKKKEYID